MSDLTGNLPMAQELTWLAQRAPVSALSRRATTAAQLSLFENHEVQNEN